MAKKIKKLPQLGPKELDGYKLGQEVYCRREPDKKLSLGKITRFHTEHENKFFTFICQVCGQYRDAFMEEIIDEPTEKIKRSVLLAMARNN
jgi:hypothetical protein